MKRLIIVGTLAIAVPMALAGCLETSDTSASEETLVEAWEPPTDGEWPGRADAPLIGFEEEFAQENPYGPTFSFRVMGTPEFRGIADDEVTMSQELLVTRLGDSSEFNAIWPTLHAGLDDTREGLYTENAEATVECESNLPNVGDSTTCVISARTKTGYVQNSFWSLHVDDFAAWPSQESRPKD